MMALVIFVALMCLAAIWMLVAVGVALNARAEAERELRMQLQRELAELQEARPDQCPDCQRLWPCAPATEHEDVCATS